MAHRSCKRYHAGDLVGKEWRRFEMKKVYSCNSSNTKCRYNVPAPSATAFQYGNIFANSDKRDGVKNGIIKRGETYINILKGGISMLRRKRKTEHYTYEARDVSHYIIVYSNNKDYGVSNLKLQKLLYFIQAYFLANDYPPCFYEKIEAWSFGPVVPEVYREYKQYGAMDIPTSDYYFKIDENNIWDSHRVYYKDIIAEQDKFIIREIVDRFADYAATDLVTITHEQRPWIEAFSKGRNSEITTEAIKNYFKEEKEKEYEC